MAKGGQFALANRGQFTPVLGGQFNWIFHLLVNKQSPLEGNTLILKRHPLALAIPFNYPKSFKIKLH